MPLPSFDAVARNSPSATTFPNPASRYSLCYEEIVDHVADILEQLAGELNGLSIDAFRADNTRGRHAARANHLLRVTAPSGSSGR
jgi:magnesium transporter